MKTLFLDCFCGISGDMTVGALIDAGADVAYLRSVADSLGLSGVDLKVDKVNKRGIQATWFQVLVDAGMPQPHRHLSHVVDIINKAAMDSVAKAQALAAFTHIGEAEAAVHGVPVEKVHFHEVGAVDSIMDIVLANAALQQLGIEQVFCSPLVVGSGTVTCDHGVMPVPAPATALLLRDIPWQAGDVACELVTPTGAALVKQWAKSFSPLASMTTRVVGYGAGTRDLPDRANVLRVFIGETTDGMACLEPVTILETTIDDANPEITALLIPILMQAGARDAYITPVLAKKGRLAQHLTVLTDREKVEALMHLLFTSSATLGVRIREELRRVLPREVRHVETPWGKVDVKVGILDGNINSAAPEFETCRVLADQHGIAVRTVYDHAMAAAAKGDFVHE